MITPQSQAAAAARKSDLAPSLQSPATCAAVALERACGGGPAPRGRAARPRVPESRREALGPKSAAAGVGLARAAASNEFIDQGPMGSGASKRNSSPKNKNGAERASTDDGETVGILRAPRMVRRRAAARRGSPVGESRVPAARKTCQNVLARWHAKPFGKPGTSSWLAGM